MKSGKLVALAIAGPTRNSQLPEVPTVAENGFPGFDVTSWYGIVVRAGTPPEIVRKVQRDMAEVLQSEDVKTRLAGLGLEPVGNTPEDFDALIKAESHKWVDIVRKANIRPQE